MVFAFLVRNDQPKALALATTLSTVKPNFSINSGPGAEAPKRSIDTLSP